MIVRRGKVVSPPEPVLIATTQPALFSACPSEPIALPVNPIEVSIQGKKARVGIAGLPRASPECFRLTCTCPTA